MDAPAATPSPEPDPAPESALRFLLNGREETVRGAPTHRTVLEHLRESGRPGTKEGCGEGDCGACTVALRGADATDADAWRAVNACLLPLASVHGAEVLTVEGLAQDGELHAVQRSMVAHGGSQCGYCTPGFVMSLFTAHAAGDLADERADLAVEGNLCRCTGYLPIRRAAHALATPRSPAPLSSPAPSPASPQALTTGDPASASAPRPAEPPRSLRYRHDGARFARPVDLDEALRLLGEEDAVAIAGATDLGVEIGKLGRRFRRLVSLEALAELRVLERDAHGLTIGAAVPLARLEAHLDGLSERPPGEALPALREMLRWFAARQIKNRATIGGNLATASPIGDLAPALLALDAVVVTAHPEGGRELPLDGFFTGYRRTLLRPGELIRAVRVPPAPDDGGTRLQHALKVGKRGTDDIAIVAGAFDVRLDGDGRVRAARLAYGGVAATPVRAKDVESWLRGRAWNAETVAGAGERLRDAFEPLDDHRGSAAYRRALSGSLFGRFAHETGATGGRAA